MTTETSIYEYGKQGLRFGAERTALWFYGCSISYGELFEKIDNVADHLYALGVREGTVVTIHLPNCPQAVMAIYAVGKLGGICNMVHALMPAKGVQESMRSTESSFLITYAPFQTEGRITVLLVDPTDYMDRSSNPESGSHQREGVSFLQFEKPAVKSAVSRPELFYRKCCFLMSSTGTTGKPKIVMLTHLAVNAWLENAKTCFPAGDKLEKQRCLSVAPFTHSMGLTADLLRAISCGGTLYMMMRWNVEEAVSIIKQKHITFMTGVPSMYQSLLQREDFSGDDISYLQYCVVGGDNVSEELKQRLDERVGKGRVCYPEYGLTEAASAVCQLTPDHDKRHASGYPIKGTKIAVLSAEGEIKASGEGELIVSSGSLMLGYFKDAEATAQALFCHDGEKWLHTGDYGSVDRDGYVFFKDRIKNIIIHNGYNIIPNEIESCIKTVDGVIEACVLEIKDNNSERTLLAAIVELAANMDPQRVSGTIETACKSSLPAYAVPRRLVFVDQLPRNALGKIERSALRELI